jgi:alpha-tubulin suppressor-like RCC1 family protein
MQALTVAAGGMHTLCVATGNKLYSWGVNDEAALGRNAGGEPWSNGNPQASDVPGAVQMPAEAGTVVSVSAGDSHSAALTADGNVYAWGTFRDEAGVMGFSAQDKFAVRAPSEPCTLAPCCAQLTIDSCTPAKARCMLSTHACQRLMPLCWHAAAAATCLAAT